MTTEEEIKEPRSTAEWADRFRESAQWMRAHPEVHPEMHPKIRQAFIEAAESEAEVLENQLMVETEDPFLQPIN